MNWPQALLFDIDGTLADTEGEGHLPAFNRAFRDFGLDWEWDRPLYRELLAVTGGQERMRHYWRMHPPATPKGADPDELVPALHRAKNEHFQRIVEAGALPWRPGVERLIKEAMARRIPVGVATTTSRSNVEALLEPVFGPRFQERFAVLACADTAPNKKPAPDVYLRAVEALGREGDRVLALEDSRNGLEAATGAGVPTLITVNDFTDHQSFPEAVAVLDHLGEPGYPCRPVQGSVAPPEGVVDLAWLQSLDADSSRAK